jgi:hypothetical protein
MRCTRIRSEMVAPGFGDRGITHAFTGKWDYIEPTPRAPVAVGHTSFIYTYQP